MNTEDKKYYLVGKAIIKGGRIIAKIIVFLGFTIGWIAMIISMFIK